MTLYIGEKPYNNSNNLSDLLSAVEKLPFHDCFYLRPLYTNYNIFYIIHKNNDIYYSIHWNKYEKAKLRSNILLIVKSQEKSVICVNKQTTEDSILNFLPKESMNKIEVAIVGDSYIENQLCAEKNANILKILKVLVNYQLSDIVINNSYIYNNINSRKLIKVDKDLLDSEGLLEQEESKILNKKPFIYGSGTMLIFLAVAATLYFSSSNLIAQIAALVFTAAAALIFAGLIGLVTHYCMKPNQKLEDMKLSESIEVKHTIKN
ncbi:MAG: hypothetical protein sL5_02460 [Candidatus Mesenet longicola]|uniref:Uncharacterized protein n=1 Tax=Candidatus Mesenet longicola TaxID=1892558 RepID=A0A8J3MNS4_9RICK|nr:MAG: hypothetical protein sGL2_02560 [Candidatus Mesenet longicola]GHM59253.1 MAG: hypothetical protein sL5_02460 [Candidatus Mesenet longicola]